MAFCIYSPLTDTSYSIRFTCLAYENVIQSQNFRFSLRIICSLRVATERRQIIHQIGVELHSVLGQFYSFCDAFQDLGAQKFIIFNV